jgi:hypothetical protein
VPELQKRGISFNKFLGDNMKEALFMESNIVKAIIGPVDLNDAATTGLRFDMKMFDRVTFFIIAAAGTTPSSHTVAFKQHLVASGGTPATLEIENPWFHKVDTASVFTKVAPSVAAASFDIDAVVGDSKFIVAFEVLAENLNVNSDYRYVSLDLTDSGGAQLGTVIAIGHNAVEKPAYTQAV